MIAMHEVGCRTDENYYGMSDGGLLHISQVESGLSCQCRCPHCGADLIAKKGDIREHHFAHYAAENCGRGGETAMHLFAKDVLARHRSVLFPAHGQILTAHDSEGRSFERECMEPAKWIDFQALELEQSYGSVRPDAVGVLHGEEIFIEIKVTHAVDTAKATEVSALRRPLLEIDLSGVPPSTEPETLALQVLAGAPRHWHIPPTMNTAIAEAFLSSVVRHSEALIAERTVAPSIAFPTVHSDQFIVVGMKAGHGYSPKWQKNFQISKLYVLREVQSSTRNFTVNRRGGFEPEELDLDEQLAQRLEGAAFPCVARLRFESRRVGNRFLPVVIAAETECPYRDSAVS